MKKIIPISVVLILSFTSAFANGMRSVEDEIASLIEKYDSSIYGAFYSLPELQPIFISIFGEGDPAPWNYWSPYEIGKGLDEEKKIMLVDKIVAYLNSKDETYRKRCIKRIRYWCIADSQFELLSEYITVERMMAAIFSVRATRDLFNDALKGRVPEDDIPVVSPEWAGGTLASGEISEIYFAALNRIAGLSEKNQLKYFAGIFNYLAK